MKGTIDHQDVKTQDDLLDYIEEYSDVIAVRERINGKWGSHFLKELPGDKAITQAFKLIREGRIPVRMKRDAEMLPESRT